MKGTLKQSEGAMEMMKKIRNCISFLNSDRDPLHALITVSWNDIRRNSPS